MMCQMIRETSRTEQRRINYAVGFIINNYIYRSRGHFGIYVRSYLRWWLWNFNGYSICCYSVWDL
nr:MAG TPA: hypothetical protein [Caudoviricetes sp.]